VDEILFLQRVHGVKTLATAHRKKIVRVTNFKYAGRWRRVLPLLGNAPIADRAANTNIEMGDGGG
jgi:hypothetical protein